MQFDSEIQEYLFGNKPVLLSVPINQQVEQYWLQNKLPQHQFPYWAKTWPAALGLCQFLVQNPAYITNKNILEIAAGLGLPSVLAAHYANHVLCSDYALDAMEYVKESATLNKLSNLETAIINWNNLPDNLSADTVLLSDINYEPEVFPQLTILFNKLLNAGKTIVLSTPQRLMAKPFIESIMLYSVLAESILVGEQYISVFVYQNKV